jgi:glycosyltransferase involved in cell wall biosynthesis
LLKRLLRRFAPRNDTNVKVLFSLTYYTPYVSGLTVYVTRIAKELTKKGVDVAILTSQHDKKLPCHPEGVQATEGSPREANQPKVIRVPYLFKLSKGFIMPLYAFESYKAIKNSDMVFVNLPQVEGFIVAFWAKILHKKLFAIYHCDLFLPKGILNYLINKIVIFCNSITLLLADRIIVYTNEYSLSSPYLSSFIPAPLPVIPAQAGIQACSGKIVQIFPPVYPLPVDEKYFQELHEKYPSHEFRIGFAARIAEEKGLEYLIEAIKDTEDMKLFIAGPKEEVAGEKKYLEKINKLFDKNKSKIIFLGKLNESQMGAFYKFIDLLVVSSVNRTEAFGLVQAEAMFAGKPVVTADLPGVRFLVESTGAGEIAKIKNSEDIKEKILKIKINYNNYQEKTKNIFQIINIEKSIQSFTDLVAS